MEFTNIEIAAIEVTMDEAEEMVLAQLDSLQLTLIGGGNAQVVVA